MARRNAYSAKDDKSLDLFDLMLQSDEASQACLDFIVDTPEKAKVVLAQLIGPKYVSFDTEGTGLEPGPDDLLLDNDMALERVPGDLFAGFSFAISPTQAWYVPTRHYQARVLDRVWVRALLDAILAIPRIRMHNARHDLKVLCGYYHEEVYLRMHIRDSLVGCHTLFQSEEGADKSKRNQLGLKKLARQILNRDAGEFDSEWLGIKILRAPMEMLATYARDDAINTFLIGDWVDTETQVQGTAPFLERVGYPLIPVFAKAHYHGIQVNREVLWDYRNQAHGKIEEMKQSLREAAGSDINPNSGVDMDHLIYDILEMPQLGERNEKGLRPLAAEDLKDVLATVDLQKKLGLRGYDDERVKFVSEFMEYQALTKLYGSFILPLLEKSARDGRIYPILKQTGTVSGRSSSTDPNGQNIPSGRKADVAGLHLDIRGVFMPDPGCVFITLDEGALEVRVLAHYCGEPTLIEALHLPKQQGGDPHQAAVDTIHRNTGILITRDQAKCVDPDTWVVVNGIYTRIGSFVPELASPDTFYTTRGRIDTGTGSAFLKNSYNNGEDDRWLICSKRGVLICSARHRVMLSDGRLVRADEIKPGDELKEVENVERLGLDAPFARINFNPFSELPGPFELALDEKWSYLAGLFVGDGCYSGGSASFATGDAGQYVGWKHELIKALRAVGLDGGIGFADRMVNIGSKRVQRLLEQLELIDIPGKCKTLRVPSWVMNGNRQVAMSFLSGLIDTDGTVGDTISVTTKDPRLAADLAVLFKRLDLAYSIEDTFNKTYQRHYYRLRLLAQSFVAFEGLLRCPWKRKAVTERNLFRKQHGIKRKNGPDKVMGVRILDRGPLVDLEVDTEDHLYRANNYVTHNTVQFGIIYGMSEHGLSLKLGISKGEARDLIEAYFTGMPFVRRWKEALEAEIRRTGIVRSLLGRIRRTELHRHNNRTVVEGALRSMINTQIQGSASDIINSATVRIDSNDQFRQTGGRICLQVHDELLANCPEATAEKAMKVMAFYMRNPFSDFHLRVPLVVEGGISTHWEH